MGAGVDGKKDGEAAGPEALDAMSNQLDRPAPVKPMGNAGQAAMAQDERAADGADEAAASSVEALQKSGGTEEASGY